MWRGLAKGCSAPPSNLREERGEGKGEGRGKKRRVKRGREGRGERSEEGRGRGCWWGGELRGEEREWEDEGG